MYLIDVIPLTKIPHTQPQILSYFFSVPLAAGALVQIPLGKRKETGVVLDSHTLDEYKQEIKKADFELRHIAKVISAQPLLTSRQIELAVWLGQYYFASPGIFAKMMLARRNPAKRDEGGMPKKQLTANSQQPTAKNQKLILVPTISQANSSSMSYLSHKSCVWHSELTKKQQNEIWWRTRNDEARIIVGTRSAVFLPFAGLKEIVIEDETNPAHRSWDMWPHYRVHEAAQKLAELFGAKLTIESEIPSIEPAWRAQALSEGRRPAPNAGQGWSGWPKTKGLRPPVKTSIVDLRTELKAGNFSIFSRELQKAINKAMAQKNQIILFVNRRGAANFVLCRDCGYTAQCENCDSPLAYHLMDGKPIMFCHRCGRQEKPPSLCPQCQSWRVKTVGTGTQKVELEAKKLFPQAKIARLDSDSAPSQKEQQKIIEAFAKKEINILIVTQIIFSWLNEIKSAQAAVVAVISADTLLHLPDFHSGERTWQTVNALKNLATKTFFIQTYNPESQTIKYAAQGDWQSFYQEEIAARQILKYPPFSQIVKLTFRLRDPQKAGTEAKILAAKLRNVIAIRQQAKKQSPATGATRGIAASSRQGGTPRNNTPEISDALPAFISKEKGRYVWNIIIKFPLLPGVILSEAKNLDKQKMKKMSSEFLRSRNSLLQYVPTNWEIDVDPVDLL